MRQKKSACRAAGEFSGAFPGYTRRKPRMSTSSRREFLEKLLVAAAAAAVPACKHNVEQEGESTSDKLRVGVIGLRGFGSTHVAAWKKRRDCEIAYLCDVDTAVGKQLLDKQFGWFRRDPPFVTDMRRIFED